MPTGRINESMYPRSPSGICAHYRAVSCEDDRPDTPLFGLMYTTMMNHSTTVLPRWLPTRCIAGRRYSDLCKRSIEAKPVVFNLQLSNDMLISGP
ncbi:hypothetical protein BD309DRAFT_957469 [Dichomitus squalens]|uniref:Uncharacterized protein n=1 Tax=Dichomitus squalens TaxID=114155 RepID=A0A4V2K4L3_9APHY|nr:hypothetical protein BD311DRAFT_95669 [Dichomitus squalens]TBU44863.1 hypothetical protein BD309DRAFT_957469 [Dichomitus squalens]